MAESQASSTSDKPPIADLGLGHLIADDKLLDPVATVQCVEIHPSGSSQNVSGNDSAPEEIITTRDEEEEIANSIERELYQLTIFLGEIEAAERLEAADVEGEGKDGETEKKEENFDEHAGNGVEEDEGFEVGNDVKMVKGDHLDEESVDKDAEGFEVEIGNDGVNGEEEEMNAGGQSGEAVRLGRQNQSNNRRRINYPLRPDAEDCAFYVKFGSCKFGLNCKFNHPPRRKNQGVKERAKNREENSEKSGQTECKYYLTSGGCRYGKDCKYSHGSERSSVTQNPEVNFLGLPIRPGEKECPYYMRTGSCKYGSNCRFHHPEPTTVGGGSASGYENGGSLPSQHISSSSISSWSPPRAFPETSTFVPTMFPPNQGPRTPSPEWNGYQATAYPTSERSLPTPPAFAMNNLPSEMNFPLQRPDMVVEDYPERPGEPECTFYLKTGDCKFRSNCKFHHPKHRNSKAKTISFSLNDKGLPLRPDQPICSHYHRYGICKYGPACKYDHPSKFAILPPPFDHPPYLNDGAEKSGHGNETESSM